MILSIRWIAIFHFFINLCRGGDFQQQFPSTTMNSSDILTGLKEYIAPGSTVFIATNEKSRSFFTSIGDVYDVIFLEDFSELLTSISKSNICHISRLPRPVVRHMLIVDQCQRHKLFSTYRADSSKP